MSTQPLWSRLDGGLVADGDDAVAILHEHFQSNRTDVSFRQELGQSIQLVTNGSRAMLVWWAREGVDDGLFAVDPDADDAEEGGFVLVNGQTDVYRSRQTVPLNRAIDAVRHAIDHSEPDPRLRWEAW